MEQINIEDFGSETFIINSDIDAQKSFINDGFYFLYCENRASAEKRLIEHKMAFKRAHKIFTKPDDVVVFGINSHYIKMSCPGKEEHINDLDFKRVLKIIKILNKHGYFFDFYKKSTIQLSGKKICTSDARCFEDVGKPSKENLNKMIFSYYRRISKIDAFNAKDFINECNVNIDYEEYIEYLRQEEKKRHEEIYSMQKM